MTSTDTPQQGAPARAAADRHEVIRVQGARENNLADISVEIPKRRLSVFTGVSGSPVTRVGGWSSRAPRRSWWRRARP